MSLPNGKVILIEMSLPNGGFGFTASQIIYALLLRRVVPLNPLSAIKKLFPFSLNAAPACLFTLLSRQDAKCCLCNPGTKYQAIKPCDRESISPCNISSQNNRFVRASASYGKKAEPGVGICNTCLISWVAITKGGLKRNSWAMSVSDILDHLSGFGVRWPVWLLTQQPAGSGFAQCSSWC